MDKSWINATLFSKPHLEGVSEFMKLVIERFNANEEILCVAELPELFQLKCLSPALEARPHLNGNNPSIPRI
jgi:hypothetical protein